MPDKRQHRGPHPADLDLFAPAHHADLKTAVADLSWLLTRGYAMNAALKLVGDKPQLTERQRLAVMRSASSDQSLQQRLQTGVSPAFVARQSIAIDGFNLLTTVEAALAGGVLLIGRDGCCRDMASMHGSYRRVEETIPALELIGECLQSLGVGNCRWLFDRPVSNSGRIVTLVRETAESRGWNWTAEVVDDPDRELIASPDIVVSADSAIIDQCNCWLNLARFIVDRLKPIGQIVDLRC